MTARAVLTHGFQFRPEATRSPVNRCGSYPEIANSLLNFWQDWSNVATHDQLSLAVPAGLSRKMEYRDQLTLGTGSLLLKNSPYTDSDFTELVIGAEFVKPILDYAQSYGYRTCRPMIRLLQPKQCLSYHKDDAPVRFHLVLSTHPQVFFIVQDVVYRMPDEGSLYTLRTDILHTAVNAHIDKPRLHFTFTGYRDTV